MEHLHKKYAETISHVEILTIKIFEIQKMHLHSHKKALSRKPLRKHKTQTNLIESSKNYIVIKEDELERIYK
jgi:hypothetical protein